MHDPFFVESRRDDLTRLKKRLLDGLENDRAELSRIDEDSDNEATDCELDIMTCLLTSRSQAELDEIQSALDRISQGTYGRCSECSCPIFSERLIVMPWAERCIDCQRLGEG